MRKPVAIIIIMVILTTTLMSCSSNNISKEENTMSKEDNKINLNNEAMIIYDESEIKNYDDICSYGNIGLNNFEGRSIEELYQEIPFQYLREGMGIHGLFLTGSKTMLCNF